YQLIVHLHDQVHGRLRVATPGVHREHRALDDVRRRALHRRIDRAALGVLLQLAVARADVGQEQTSAEHRLDVAFAARLLARALHVTAYTRVAREVQVDVILGRAARHAELTRQAEGRHAVDEAEVDGLGRAALIGRDRLERQAEYLRGGRLMDVAILREGAQQAL